MTSFRMKGKRVGAGGAPKPTTAAAPAVGLFQSGGGSHAKVEEAGESSADEDDVAAALAREATTKKQRAEREAAEQLAAADPSVYDYDDAYDDIQQQRKGGRSGESQARGREPEPQKAKYIGALKAKAAEREAERARVKERKVQRELEEEAHLYADKEKFVTRAYKDKLAELHKKDEEDRIQEEEDAKRNVSGQKDISGFYFNLLSRNVAMGATEEEGQEEVPNSGRAPERRVEARGGGDAAQPNATEPRTEAAPRHGDSNSSAEGRGVQAETAASTAANLPERNAPKPASETKLERAMRLNRRRNDEASIEAARQRYFQRRKEREQSV